MRAQRLVTLVGPSGTGKTRLALQVAAEQVESFADGVFMIALESISDPALVLPAVAGVLGVRERPGNALADTLSDYLRSRQMLLLLDNFEQVLPAAPALSDLLAAAPGLKLLVTSRSVLQLYGEVSYAVAPLPLPETSQRRSLDELLRNECLALFVERARAARTSFRLTDDNASAVVEICRQLDGLPLALELAAARVRLLPPQKIVEQLKRRFQFLTGGPRDMPSRHQTLRAALDWSYHLLAKDEQRLFERLSVFVGGCTVEAAEAAVGDGLSVLDGMSTLLDKSLLYQSSGPAGEPRFMMLVTLREYGAEQLQASGDVERLRGQHATFFHDFLAASERQEFPSREARIRHLHQEYDNLRAALKWMIEMGEARRAIEMCLGLSGYFDAKGLREGPSWFKAALAVAGEAPAMLRVKALQGAASLSWNAGNFQAALDLVGEGLRLCRENGLEEPVFWLLIILCRIGIEQGDYRQAQAASADALAISRKLGDRNDIVAALAHQGETALAQGDHIFARRVVEEAVELCRAGRPFLFSVVALRLMGEIRYEEGDHTGAYALLRESLEHGQAAYALRALTVSLGTIAGYLAAESGRHSKDRLRAVRILAALSVYQEATGVSYSKAKREKIDQQMMVARQVLGSTEWQAAWAEGRKETLEQAVAEAKQP